MSRSRGPSSFTRSPPMIKSPSEISSRPAIIRSAVDFPQPDGPTRIMNSPSPISRSTALTASVPSGYRFVTFWSWISAIRTSPLHRAGGEPGDDSLLEQEDENDQRDRDHDRGRGLRPERHLELRGARELRDRHRDRAGLARRRQRQREQELVPRCDEREDRRRGQAGRRERHHDLPERLEMRRAVYQRRLLEVL